MKNGTCKYLFTPVFLYILFALNGVGCKKFIEVQPPAGSLSQENIYSTDATAISVLTGIYINTFQNGLGMGNLTSVSLFPALSADELTLYDLTNGTDLPYYTNSLTATISWGYWEGIYPIVYVANSAVEGISSSTSLTPAIKQQLLGEALFMRAYCYFYLVNFYGDVPLVTSTDYAVNSLVYRTPKSQVWNQIIQDLHTAENTLSTSFLDATLLNATFARVRPTKWAASALLARAYLYTKNWSGADSAASAVIDAGQFSLNSLDSVFLANSNEAIWQLQPTGSAPQVNTPDGALFILPSSGPSIGLYPVYLSNDVVNSFEPGDNRLIDWTDSVTVGTVTYYYPYKYKIGFSNGPTLENEMMLRLGEQYLIRSEARLMENNLPGAISDLNIIRARAALDSTSANNPQSLMTAILHERQVELFTEGGHRWLDLQRTGSLDSVMTVVAPQKLATWNSYKALYPIPSSEILADPNLVQNSGY